MCEGLVDAARGEEGPVYQPREFHPNPSIKSPNYGLQQWKDRRDGFVLICRLVFSYGESGGLHGTNLSHARQKSASRQPYFRDEKIACRYQSSNAEPERNS
jgi:hypothetical protein